MRGAKPGRALDAIVRAAMLPPDGPIVVACSGGPDSVALAAVLDRIARSAGFELVLAHVNHGIRPSAWQDECVALAVGMRLGRPVHVAAPAPDGTAEAALRRSRYTALAQIAARCGATTIATAHTAEDQTESILLALFRGTGLAGLGGIAPTRSLDERFSLIRPLLRVTHAELQRELQRSGLPYAIDPTNADRRYRRNAVRGALSALRADFPQLDRSVARCAHIVREELAGGERAIGRRRLRAQLQASGTLRDVPFERIEAALGARPRRRVFLKPGLEIEMGDPHARH